jgi:uncharacterized protein (TIGR02757 family)
VAGLFAAGLAIGRVDRVREAVQRVLHVLGPSPHRFIRAFDLREQRHVFHGFVYRFFREQDMAVLALWLHRILKTYGHLEILFMKGYRDADPDVGPALSHFVRSFRGLDTWPVVRSLPASSGLRAFFSDPAGGSGCKRLNLFLRWMVRRGEPDLGLWRGVDPAKLVIPLDTHVIRLGRMLGLTARATPDWKMAQEITRSIRVFEPTDPVKYDFALCHAGMERSCPDGGRDGCDPSCPFASFCARAHSSNEEIVFEIKRRSRKSRKK